MAGGMNPANPDGSQIPGGSGWYYTPPSSQNGYSTTPQNGGTTSVQGGGVNYYAQGKNPDGTQVVNNVGDNNYWPRYGGANGGANKVATQYGNLAAAAQGRAAPQMNRALVGADRNAGLDSLRLQGLAAGGGVPSAATMNMAQGNNDTISAQMAAANSARPGGSLALQGRMAQQGGMAMQGQNINQGANARAQELAQARNAYAQQAVGMQGLDQKFAAQQATLNAQQGEENDKTSLDYSGLANQVQQGQLTADLAQYNAQNSNYQQMNQAQADRTNSLIGGGSSAASYAAMAAMMA
jgi:hypothetical protein